MNITAGTYTAPGRAMNVSAPRLQQVAPSATPILSLSPNAIISIVFVACVGVGSLMAINPKAAVAALVALCYLPLVLINLPLGIALWIPTTFLTGLSGFDSASHAAGLVIAFAWFGTLRNKAREQQVAIPTKLLSVVALLVIWLALSMIWAEKPASSFTALQPWAACALMFVVLMTIDLTRAQIRMLDPGLHHRRDRLGADRARRRGEGAHRHQRAAWTTAASAVGSTTRTTSPPASCPPSRSPRDFFPASAAPSGASRWRGPAWRS